MQEHPASSSGALMDFLAKLAGKRDVPNLPQVTQLEELLASAEGERERIAALLASIKGTGDDVDAVPRVVERLEHRTGALKQLFEEMSARADRLQASSSVTEALEARIAALEGCVQRAEARAEDAVQRAEQAGQQREALQALVSMAHTTVERLEALAADERLTRAMELSPVVREECEQTAEAQVRLSAHLDALRETSLAVIQRTDAASELASR